MSGSVTLQVVTRAFGECALILTDQGGRIASLAGELRAGCFPLADPSVGGAHCGTLGQQTTTLAGSLRAVGEGGCTGMVQTLQRLLAGFQEVDGAQAAHPPTSSPRRATADATAPQPAARGALWPPTSLPRAPGPHPGGGWCTGAEMAVRFG